MSRVLLFVLFYCTSCSSYKTPELPSLDAKSFSYEEIMKKQDELKQKTLSIRKENSEPAKQ
ncbi:hypothetical protein FACS1894122_09430 [Alphaproteobacteria bacterium]|nr:hypothetical protein FACS1894122_09430 [Alphaproteobacteria bacterium]